MFDFLLPLKTFLNNSTLHFLLNVVEVLNLDDVAKTKLKHFTKMKKTNFITFLTLATILFFTACSNNAPKDSSTTTTATTTVTPPAAPAPEKLCFVEVQGKDSTIVKLTIDGAKVTGTMIWHPHEQDGAVGTLTGTKTATGEMDMLYAYTIEGSNQTETKMMKIENGQLMIKRGMLDDPKNDGNMRYKDVAKATYKQVLKPMVCR